MAMGVMLNVNSIPLNVSLRLSGSLLKNVLQ